MNRTRLAKDCPGLIDEGGLLRLENGRDPRPCARHQDGNNYIFTDGHVKWEHVMAIDGWKTQVSRTTEKRP